MTSISYKEMVSTLPPGCKVKFDDFYCEGEGAIVGVYPGSKGYANWSILIYYERILWKHDVNYAKPYPVVMVDFYGYGCSVTGHNNIINVKKC